MNIVERLESYETNNKVYSNGKTKFASIHIAMLGLAKGLTRTETEELLKTSSDIFVKLMKDIDREDEEFETQTYIDIGLNLFDYLTSISIYEEIDMKEVFGKD